jgi:hypothetical protein
MTTSQASQRWPSLLDTDQVAAMTGMHPQTIGIRARAGDLRARKMPGGTLVFSRAEVLVDVARHKQAIAEDYATRGGPKRGRPPGSKNKVKDKAIVPAASDTADELRFGEPGGAGEPASAAETS